MDISIDWTKDDEGDNKDESGENRERRAENSTQGPRTYAYIFRCLYTPLESRRRLRGEETAGRYQTRRPGPLQPDTKTHSDRSEQQKTSGLQDAYRRRAASPP